MLSWFGESNVLFGFGEIADAVLIDDFFVHNWVFGFVMLCGLQLNLLFLNWVFGFVIICELHGMLVGGVRYLVELLRATQAVSDTAVIKKEKNVAKLQLLVL